MSEAEQTALEAEHAAVWLLALLGGRVDRGAQPGLRRAIDEAYTAHRARRDALSGALRDAGETPVAAQASYDEPGPLDTTARVRAAAREAEAACAEVWGFAVASTAGERRTAAIAALRDCAVRAVGFGAEPTPLPGGGEPASS